MKALVGDEFRYFERDFSYLEILLLEFDSMK